MNNTQAKPFIIEGVEFVYRRNFEGRAERYNNAGDRYFNAKIADDLAPILLRDGWNVKETKPGANHPNPSEHVPEFYLPVKVGFQFRPPTIILIRDGHQTALSEEQVSLVDSLIFENIDVSIRPVPWSSPQGSGITAYLKSFYGTVEMDDLDRKYFVPEAQPTPADGSESWMDEDPR